MKPRQGRRGQSGADYAITLSVVIAALTAVGVIVGRGIQANGQKGVLAMTGISAEIKSSDAKIPSAKFEGARQMESYVPDSFSKRVAQNVKREIQGDGGTKIYKPSDINFTAAGSIQKQRTAKTTAGESRRQKVQDRFE